MIFDKDTDSALLLKYKYDHKEISDFNHAKKLLNDSNLLKKLLSDFDPTVLNLHWRLTQLSEIPFTGKIEKVQRWLSKLTKMTYTGEGFSLTGKNDYILSCYNGMITTLLIRFGSEYVDKILKGIDWILKYQNFERNLDCKWNGSAIKKYGGCLKATPCYIGLVKSLIALSSFKNSPLYKKDPVLEEKLAGGLEYILNQEVYKRKSNGKPITNYIDKITYPFYYKTNIIEILHLLKENHKLKDVDCKPAIDLLYKKRKKDGYWKSINTYKSGIWIPFCESKKPDLWTTYIIESILN
jgi:hypothetical protein